MRSLTVSQFVALLLTACSQRAEQAAVISHPTEFVGRWVRQRDDKSWGDTLDLRSDGSVGGSSHNPVPASAKWGVKQTALASEFCAVDAKEGSCQTFQFVDSLLVVGGGPNGKSIFRRVR